MTEVFPGSGGMVIVAMPMRDYFAGQALAAILPQCPTIESRRGADGVQALARDYAGIAYWIADAMLSEGERGIHA